MRFLSFILLFLASASLVLADAKIKFTELTHNFGTIQEKDGDVTYKFVFLNEGDSPLIITRAQTSCGCTTPAFTKKPVRPGEQGEVTVTYHAKGRPGPFDKSIYVYSNDKKQEKSMLTITGNVINNTSLIDTYTEQLGAGIRVKLTSLNYFDVYPGRAYRTRTLQVYNEGDESVKLTFRNIPKHLGITCEPEMILPKAEGRVLITYMTDKVKDWGPRKDKFDLFVKGHETKMRNNTITVMADIWEDFSELNKAERQNAAEVEVSDTKLDFGKGSSARSQKLTIRNTGHEKLVIRKIHNELPEIFRTQLEETTLKPGQSTSLTITFDPKGTKQSSFKHHITVITNDPSNSRVMINLQAGK